jgi:muramoyltetrapeptide carboxypeptidase LdcA involved in peptidoglycan recycling
MKVIIPRKLKKGDEVRVIAPAFSLSIISKDNRLFANKRLKSLGLNLTFGKNTEKTDDFNSSSIDSRIEDLHVAFKDRNVKAIFSVIGGYNSNQLLSYIDWNLIKKNPKIFCGYSDISALQNAIFAKTGLVTYSGPSYSSFSEKLNFNYTYSYFKKCLMSNEKIVLSPSSKWSDDKWYLKQNSRHFIKNDGWRVINDGKAKGVIIGGNLCTLNLLQGTGYFPNLDNSILFIEDYENSDPVTFDRDLQSLIQQKRFNGVKGLVIGRFQKKSKMKKNLLDQIILSKRELSEIPVIVDVDFGHTEPKITFPIGGEALIDLRSGRKHLEILKH